MYTRVDRQIGVAARGRGKGSGWKETRVILLRQRRGEPFLLGFSVFVRFLSLRPSLLFPSTRPHPFAPSCTPIIRFVLSFYFFPPQAAVAVRLSVPFRFISLSLSFLAYTTREHPENSHLHTIMRFHNIQRAGQTRGDGGGVGDCGMGKGYTRKRYTCTLSNVPLPCKPFTVWYGPTDICIFRTFLTPVPPSSVLVTSCSRGYILSVRFPHRINTFYCPCGDTREMATHLSYVLLSLYRHRTETFLRAFQRHFRSLLRKRILKISRTTR